MLIRNFIPTLDTHSLNFIDGKTSKRRQDKVRLATLPNFKCYVASDNFNVVGFIVIEDLGDGLSYYIVQINVATKRIGIGSALMSHAIIDLKIPIGGQISLCVNTDNHAAIAFYERWKFRRSGMTWGYKKGQDKFWYRLDIEPETM